MENKLLIGLVSAGFALVAFLLEGDAFTFIELIDEVGDLFKYRK